MIEGDGCVFLFRFFRLLHAQRLRMVAYFSLTSS
jgi:hypothetical protein